jgi:hypothetical protein
MSENIEVIKKKRKRIKKKKILNNVLSIEAPIILDTPTNEPNLTIDLLKRKFEHLDEEINQINAQCNKSSCEIKNIPEKNTICNKISRCFRKRKISIIN